MKVYDFVGAPNPKKLRVYLAEKGITIPCQQVNIVTGENRNAEFLKKNPLGGLPVLELDDGSHLTESLAIIEYLEDLHPTPPMIGTTPLERARVRELERICELGVLSSVAQIFQNTHPFMAGCGGQRPHPARQHPEGAGRHDRRQPEVRRRFAPHDRRLHAARGPRVRRIRAGAARSGVQERDALVRGLQGAPERAGVAQRAPAST